MAERLPDQMRVWTVAGQPGAPGRLSADVRAVPSPQVDEILVEVAACGVCRTDLHLADGDLPARAPAACRGTRSSAGWSRGAPRPVASRWVTG